MSINCASQICQARAIRRCQARAKRRHDVVARSRWKALCPPAVSHRRQARAKRRNDVVARLPNPLDRRPSHRTSRSNRRLCGPMSTVQPCSIKLKSPVTTVLAYSTLLGHRDIKFAIRSSSMQVTPKSGLWLDLRCLRQSWREKSIYRTSSKPALHIPRHRQTYTQADGHSACQSA